MQVCMYGRHVCMGYLNNETKTRDAIDDEGWLHSGDIGKIDKDNFLHITGRIKGEQSVWSLVDTLGSVWEECRSYDGKSSSLWTA